MSDVKQLKDPVYGYIEVPADYMFKIVDTDIFQRLRRIVQTSYSPLFSSAVHNRFVHSLGVYHLGVLAARNLCAKLTEVGQWQDFHTGRGKEDFLQRCEKTFVLSCLLHDIGHAPFSHTGEDFYLDSPGDVAPLHGKLEEVVGIKIVPVGATHTAAAHEIMSAIIGLHEFSNIIGETKEKEFFARCITGYEYDEINQEDRIKNMFVKLLNAPSIDVDKLDYLLRDAKGMGFDSVTIDYQRLLCSVTVYRDQGGALQLGYDKGAVSVLENVIYARDLEKKWIQNHPTVVYETYLLQRAMSHLCKRMDKAGRKLFSEAALGHEGLHWEDDHISVRLLSDDDIVYLMKNVYANRFADEYFMRSDRRHPVWKSEVEYMAYFRSDETQDEIFQRLKNVMAYFTDYMRMQKGSGIINKYFEKRLEKEVQELDNFQGGYLTKEDKEVQYRDKKDLLKIIKELHLYADEMRLRFDFLILPKERFISGFGQSKFAETNIVFKDNAGRDTIASVQDVISSFSAKPIVNETFFYLFYKRNKGYSVLPSSGQILERLKKVLSANSQ